MVTSTTRGERRMKSRKRPLRLVYVELASANGGMMRDLSEEGFAVRAMIPVRAGDRTPFSFSLDKYTRIEGQGQILWVQENGHVAGVRFVEIDSSAREMIREWLSKPDTPEAAEAPVAGSGDVSLEQLRKEMYSVPPRPEGTLPMPAAEGASKPAVPEPVVAPQAATFASAQKTMPVEELSASSAHEDVKVESELAVSAEKAESRQQQIEKTVETTFAAAPPAVEEHTRAAEMPRADDNPFEQPAAPALPRFSLTPRVAEPQVQSVATVPSPIAEQTAAPKTHWDAVPPAPGAGETPSPQLAEPQLPPLPDISTILMQPHTQAAAATHIGTVGALPPLEPRPSERMGDRVSFSGVVTLMTTLALLAGLYVFHKEVGTGLIWLGQSLGGETQVLPTGTLANSANAPESAAPVVQQPPAGNRGTQSSDASSNTRTASPDPGATNASAGASPLSNDASPSSIADSSQADYTQAMQLLRTRNPSSTPDALRLLWISVEKGNANAELQLAQMYWHGQGVIQNCDQAHILLTAAARKGNTEAAKQLIEFQRIGCK